MTWREKARPVIAEVLAAHQGEDLKTIRRALKEAYPFGPRQHHPYQIWCDEVRSQLGLKRYPLRKKQTLLPHDDPRQQEMFKE